ncbi:hypothetical protein ACRAWC_07680 [Leifsonia sp. L25]|uniref:hypothetical protein n=1 Tax=Actinomycetes TaxID=1760 RepID=UPI003D69198D
MVRQPRYADDHDRAPGRGAGRRDVRRRCGESRVPHGRRRRLLEPGEARRAPAHPKPASQDHGREPPKTGGGHQGPATGSGTAEAGDAPGGPVSPPSSTQKDAGEQKASSPEAANGEAAQTGRPAPGGEGSTTGESGTSSNRSTGEGGDQGESGASSTQKKAPARFQPAPSPGPSADSPPVTQDGSSGSGGQGTGR